MRITIGIAILTLAASPALALDNAGRSHLEHIASTGLGTQVAQQVAPAGRLYEPPPQARAKTRRQAGRTAKKTGRKTRRAQAAAKPVNARIQAERGGFKKVSSLVNFPEFFPGIGILYVKPETLPVGPFLSFDRKDTLISTIYMLSLGDQSNHKKFDTAGAPAKVDHFTAYFNGGHPGVDFPHYHYVLWHVSKKDEARVAK